MPTISATLTDAGYSRVVDALCGLFNYPGDTLPDGTPNPVTPGQFAQQCVATYLRESVLTWESHLATAQIRSAAEASGELDIGFP